MDEKKNHIVDFYFMSVDTIRVLESERVKRARFSGWIVYRQKRWQIYFGGSSG